ncbi:MAG: choice-of-anchor tandem repeat NxxGxxAF-containing protein [Phycisphaerales bacterium JB037]
MNYSSFEQLSLRLNDEGEVAFIARLAGTGVNPSNNFAVFSGSVGHELTARARAGDQAGGLDTGVVFTSGFIGLSVRLNDAGEIAFLGTLTGPGVDGSNNSALLVGPTGGLPIAVAREGDPAPGLTGDVSYFAFANPELAASGGLAFSANLNGDDVGPSNAEGLFRRSDTGSLGPIARGGWQAPELASGIVFGAPPFESMSLSDAGHVAFLADLAGPGVGPTNDQALFSDGSGLGLEPIARTGDQAGDLPFGVLYEQFRVAHIAADGRSVFWSTLTGAGVDATNNSGIFREAANSGIVSVARTGDSAAGFDPEILYSGIGAPGFVLNEAGGLAFVATLAGPGMNAFNNQVIFRELDASGPEPVVRLGDQAAGLAPGVRYASLSQLKLSNAGSAAFFSTLSAGSASFEGIFVITPSGDIRPAIVEGDQIDVNPDPLVTDLRTVTILSGNYGLNSRGEVLFTTSLSGGATGIFVSMTVHACPADLTSSSDPNDPGYGEPDGDLDANDFFFYLDAFVARDLGVCDLTGLSDSNDPTYGIPDGDCDADDFFFYLDLFVAGCA